jgi:hypothetical protein
MATKFRHQRSLRHDELMEPDFGREAELPNVIEDVEARLAKLGRITTPDVFEETLGAIQAVGAPYAIALLYEVRRLERLLRQTQAQRTIRGARRSTFATGRRRRKRRGMRRVDA